MSAPRPSEDTPMREDGRHMQTGNKRVSQTLDLPQIPTTDLSLDFSDFIEPDAAEVKAKLQKRASTVMKLAEENEKLKAELKAMSERVEQAEQRRQKLMRMREQRALEEPSS
ncbi:hypothetical protein CPB84DRAFT_1846493 [Gymnopilus junonius]|uniref:Uncharacterized protein n=1 Tax=Gymnopilus junonius TaxID=109634 RepID=A0A9P5TPL2_GYMJU|nr:hypothetical protein CPB84DRAFT_1846493 [Gymnopilus junonius]